MMGDRQKIQQPDKSNTKTEQRKARLRIGKCRARLSKKERRELTENMLVASRGRPRKSRVAAKDFVLS
jgi:hypothetical protein